MQTIKVIDRYKSKVFEEKVYGEKAVSWLYESPLGKLVSPIVTARALSQFYGLSQDSSLSAKKVPGFIRSFDINVDEYQKGSFEEKPFEKSFKSFNEFFIRRFKDGMRSFDENASLLSAPCEARYFVFEDVDRKINLPVKGDFLALEKLIDHDKWNKHFHKGQIVIARLCPVDYHRFHYPLDGNTVDWFRRGHVLESVNPVALKAKPDIFIENERVVNILNHPQVGDYAYIEVGATCVGKIVQSANPKDKHQKGDEKGYFLFGGSTVILAFAPGAIKFDDDLIYNSKQGMETFIKLGDQIGTLR